MGELSWLPAQGHRASGPRPGGCVVKEGIMIIQDHVIAGRMPVFQRWGRDAIREDRKTQTRRVAKVELCPYGKIGDIRVMCEPLTNYGGFACYADDTIPVISTITGALIIWRWKVQTLSSLFMPY